MLIRTHILVPDSGNACSLGDILKRNCNNVEVVSLETSIHKGLRLLEQGSPDLVIIGSGFADFDILGKATSVPGFRSKLLVSGKGEKFALDAFRDDAVDILPYPYDPLQVQKAIHKVERVLHYEQKIWNNMLDGNGRAKPTKLAIPTSNGCDYVEMDNIVRMEADRSYCSVFLANGRRYVVSKCMNDFAKLLEGHNFFRAHHSHLINLLHVNTFARADGGYVVLSDGAIVPLSRLKKDEFQELIREHVLLA